MQPHKYLPRSFVLFTAVLFGIITATATSAGASDRPEGVTFTEMPTDLQFFARDEANLAIIRVAGFVDSSASPLIRKISIGITRDDQPWLAQQFAFDDATPQAGPIPFEFALPIEAGLFSYDLRVSIENTDEVTIIDRRVHDLVAGDVYLVQGQSNAVAMDYHNEDLANESKSKWIRSFGSASTNKSVMMADRRWHLADGEGGNGSGTVGAWALRMARLVVDDQQIPIGLLNGAVGGTAISYHLRDDSNPLNLDTNYGRLLARARFSGVASRAHAILWYQGESDGSLPPETYFERFRDLYRDWVRDYRGLQKIYVFQVRRGCGAPTVELRDMLRQLQDRLPGIEVMSTTAAPEHDGCHFFYSGYRELGDRRARLLFRDFYGETENDNITPPNPDRATFTTEERDEILVTMRVVEDELTCDPDAYQTFRLEGGGAETIIGSQIDPVTGGLLLTLDAPSTATGITFLGKTGDGPWVTNANGVGLLTFYNIPIE